METQVKDSRPSEDAAAIRRRRFCPSCAGRFTTFERVQLRELMIVKRSGGGCPSTATSWCARCPSRCASGPVDRSRSSGW
jgi:transcriptional repressor NrdR